MACEVAMADLNLTPEQKTKMDTLMAEHHKEGCTKDDREEVHARGQRDPDAGPVRQVQDRMQRREREAGRLRSDVNSQSDAPRAVSARFAYSFAFSKQFQKQSKRFGRDADWGQDPRAARAFPFFGRRFGDLDVSNGTNSEPTTRRPAQGPPCAADRGSSRSTRSPAAPSPPSGSAAQLPSIATGTGPGGFSGKTWGPAATPDGNVLVFASPGRFHGINLKPDALRNLIFQGRKMMRRPDSWLVRRPHNRLNSLPQGRPSSYFRTQGERIT